MTARIATDPGFALAHAGKAQVLMRQGDVAAARAALAAAKEAAPGLSGREASHIAFFELVFAGRTEAAIAANPNGLIALDDRARQMEAIARDGRYPSGSYLPTLARGFAAFERGDFSAAIAAFSPLTGDYERIGGSRAQHDLIEFTLLKAYLDAGRLEEARQMLGARRPGASGVPVTGVAALH